MGVISRRRIKKITSRNPNWFFRTTYNYLIARYSNLRRARAIYQIYYCDETNQYSEAKRLGPDIHENFRSRTAKTPASFVAVLKNGRVCGQTAFVLTANYKLLRDVSLEFTVKHLNLMRKRKAYNMWRSRKFKYVRETVAVLCFCSAHNYYHWMMDVLPRIELLRLSGIQIDKYVMNRQSILPFQDETLAVLGIPRDKIIDSRVDMQARKLVVPSLITRYIFKWGTYVRPDVIPKWACEFLRNQFLHPSDTDPSDPNEYIYISRENAIYRRVINEEEILDRLSTFGFKKVNLESMTVAEQIELFSRAKVIIAPHGAGLVNLVFCKPGTKVIELFAPNYMPSYYWMISNHVQLDYYYLVNKGQTNRSSSDFAVNIDRLLEMVQYVGL